MWLGLVMFWVLVFVLIDCEGFMFGCLCVWFVKVLFDLLYCDGNLWVDKGVQWFVEWCDWFDDYCVFCMIVLWFVNDFGQMCVCFEFDDGVWLLYCDDNVWLWV